MDKKTIRYIDMFSGIGGFREGFTRAGGFRCVGHCEIDKHADRSYRALFNTNGEWFCEDATKAEPKTMPDFDLLCGGFPCQSFSVAGHRLGFEDARGTLFFELARLAESKRPSYLLFENVPGLLSHDGGKTFCAILDALSRLRYHVEWQVLNSKDHGVPQARKRVYIVGYLDERCAGKILPITGTTGTHLIQLVSGPQGKRVYDPAGTSCTLTALSGGVGSKTGLYDVGVPIKVNTKSGYTKAYQGDSIDLTFAGQNARRGRVGRQIAHTLTTVPTQATVQFIDLNPEPQITENARCIIARQDNGIHNRKGERSGVLQEGRIRRLTPRECLRLQGFYDAQIDIVEPMHSDSQLYKQAGNGVTVNVVEAIGRRIFAIDEELKRRDKRLT
ncbi:MAG: DNA (cytosine-5-)-methyltransferase [Oscillospiraceae bacterium]